LRELVRDASVNWIEEGPRQTAINVPLGSAVMRAALDPSGIDPIRRRPVMPARTMSCDETMLRRVGLLPVAGAALLLLSACAATVAPAPMTTESVSLPRGADTRITDPVRHAVSHTSYVFATAPEQLAGRPAEAAEAALYYEYMAARLTGPYERVEYRPLHPQLLLAGRAELRQALGIAPTAPAQATIDSLWRVAEATRSGNREAATQAATGGVFTAPPEQTLTRLASLPPLPMVARASADAYGHFRSQDMRGSSNRRLW